MSQLARRLLGCVLPLALASPPANADAEWAQWGGPRRDFTAPASARMDSFPPGGPRLLWSRELGSGFSGIVTAGDRLVTLYRRQGQDVLVAIDRSSGGTLWEYAYDAPVPRNDPSVETSYGEGPNSTPLVADGRAYSISFSGVVNAVALADGKPVWAHDLGAEFGVRIPYFGHSASPLRHGDTVIFIAGGAFAFDLATGEVRWANREFGATYGSPLLVPRRDGPILVAAVSGGFVGVDPDDGKLLWRHEHANQHGSIINSPIFADDRLFISAFFLGSAALKLSPDGHAVEKQWETPQVQFSQFNAVRSRRVDLRVPSLGADGGQRQDRRDRLASSRPAALQHGSDRGSLPAARQGRHAVPGNVDTRGRRASRRDAVVRGPFVDHPDAGG